MVVEELLIFLLSHVPQIRFWASRALYAVLVVRELELDSKMVARNTFNNLLVLLGCSLVLIAHSPVATATTAPSLVRRQEYINQDSCRPKSAASLAIVPFAIYR